MTGPVADCGSWRLLGLDVHIDAGEESVVSVHRVIHRDLMADIECHAAGETLAVDASRLKGR